MIKQTKQLLKIASSLIFLLVFLNSCAYHKDLTGTNDFHSLVSNLVQKSSTKLKKYIFLDEVVLVSDFVNLDKLQNHSKLGFLLSHSLKDSLLNKNIIVREVELSENLMLGKHGFNVLTRQGKNIKNKTITNTRHAVVGTYILTNKNLIVFVKLINIHTGDILSSAQDKISIDEEILELEETEKKRRLVFTPLVL